MKKSVIIILLGMVLVSPVLADGIIKLANLSYRYLTPKTTDVTVVINNQIATTIAKQQYYNNTGQDVVIQYGFPLNINASVIDFKWIINGQGYRAEIQGQPQDTTSTGGGGEVDHQFLDFLGESPFIFSFNDTLKADSMLTTQITLIELLKYRSGEMVYSYPTQLPGFTGQVIENFHISMSLASERTITSFSSPSHPGCVIDVGPKTGSLNFTLTNVSAPSAFLATYSVSQSEFGVSLIGVKPSHEDGFFLMLAEPDPSTSQEDVIDKVFTYIIDVSGSMTGQKIEQAKEAARYCINHLNSGDKFNIIKFNTSATRFVSNPVPATPQNVQNGLAYINSLTAGGGTNLGVALLNGLSQNMSLETSNIFIFLTDGIGSIDFAQVKAANTNNVRIFVFGIGSSVDEIVLRRIAADNNGVVDFLGNDQVATKIPEFYNKIRNPLILNTMLDFSSGGVNEIYPLQLPDIYVGEQLVVAGRYTTAGPTTITLKGKTVDDTISYTYDIVLPADSTGNIFVAKMWAKLKIESLLLLIAQVGEHSNPGKEYIAEVIRLSKLYGIMTSYTSFRDTGDPTGVEMDDAELTAPLPLSFELLQNYPNPFNPTTTIQFRTLDNFFSGVAILKIYNMRGQLVRIYRIRISGAGLYTITWDGTDQLGENVSSGTYIYQLWVGDQVTQKTMLLLR